MKSKEGFQKVRATLKSSRNRDYCLEAIVVLGEPTPYCIKYHSKLDADFMKVHGCLKRKCPHFVYTKIIHRFA
jgi:hypothetical protein